MTKTVLNLIPVSEIEKWKAGDHVLVIAGTGKCKTTWVKQVLWPYCREKGLSLFTLANRSMLRDDIRHGSDMPVLTYQLLEQKADHPAWNADVIVMDECHSLATDVMLDYRRNKMLRFFENKQTIIIGLTATPVDCVTELFNQDKIYRLERNYSQLESVHLFYRERDLMAILEKKMREGGRILCFVRSAAAGLKMHRALPDTAYICSRNAVQWTPETEEYKEAISRNRRWDKEQVLIATKVMDVGVSIEDTEVTTVIVETEDYTVDLIQMIGRIRCREGQRIRLFIRVFPQNYLKKRKQQLCMTREKIDRLFIDPEDLPYERGLFPLVLANGTRNELAIRWLDQQIADVTRQLELGTEAIISEQLCGTPLCNWREAKDTPVDVERCIVQQRVQYILDDVVGKHFYDKNKLFERFADIVPAVLKNDKLRPSRKNIEAVLRELRLSYRVIRKQQSRGKLRGKYFYQVERLS